jgi:hypothetical protein
VQTDSTKVPLRKSHITGRIPNSNTGFYCENTIIPGSVPMEKGEPEIAVGTPVFVL